ncbi:hypothetical protein [Bradyrhizobium sp. Leo121]|uniref:hypothetical protein n=1 Tax=Bradyrhizobium sp. Leo121 TaxID=1571195 RepID=UPI001029115D|nr:hypothetical protein [Bradyrhizobium sp. Leo121]RZN19498.1 hypothetical protein CWO90_35295 [Bradyrhizobium sp. Leo121]
MDADLKIDAMREGDIFRWSYRNPNASHGVYSGYHCCSRIAVFTNGLLRDTYWGLGCIDGRWFSGDAIRALDLEFVGNFADLKPANEHMADYFDDADIVDLNHSNSTRGNFYLRKGAVRSKAKMLEVARYRLDQSLSAERTAAWKSEQLRETIARIEAGETELFI